MIKNNLFSIGLIALLLIGSTASFAQQGKKTPIMGWSSWNNYRVDINEDIIKAQADALISTGMKEAGYNYINIDDGFFGGRDAEGNIIPHQERFPRGMKNVADYIHSKRLKAGIYSDAGSNTCASMWDADTIGVGMGLYHHEEQDLRLMLNDWGYDFIKIDWCGGEKLGLDEEQAYTRIGNLIKEIKPEVIYNVCRWEFPGKWVMNTAESWRISGDINNTFESILHIIDLNADLWKYSGPGHVNDMDMLQVGRGMTYEEDKAHFSMWAIMTSPLLAGNDLTKMSKETIEILTNKEIIAINQDPLVYQARRLKREGDVELWGKPLKSLIGGEVAVALLNRNTNDKKIKFDISEIGLDPAEGYDVRDVWNDKDFRKPDRPIQEFLVPGHGVVVLVIKGTSMPFNVFQNDKIK